MNNNNIDIYAVATCILCLFVVGFILIYLSLFSTTTTEYKTEDMTVIYVCEYQSSRNYGDCVGFLSLQDGGVVEMMVPYTIDVEIGETYNVTYSKRLLDTRLIEINGNKLTPVQIKLLNDYDGGFRRSMIIRSVFFIMCIVVVSQMVFIAIRRLT